MDDIPTLATPRDFQKWVPMIEKLMENSGLPEAQWPDAAIIFLVEPGSPGKVDKGLRLRRQSRKKAGLPDWEWHLFKSEIFEVLVEIENEHSSAFEITLTTAAKVVVGTGLIVGGTTVLAPALIVGALNCVGFTPAGVASGSLAATMQSIFYGGATTGLFSLCQSVGTAAVASAPSIATAAGSVAAGTRILRSGVDVDSEGTKKKPTTCPPLSVNGSNSQPPRPRYT